MQHSPGHLVYAKIKFPGYHMEGIIKLPHIPHTHHSAHTTVADNVENNVNLIIKTLFHIIPITLVSLHQYVLINLNRTVIWDLSFTTGCMCFVFSFRQCVDIKTMHFTFTYICVLSNFFFNVDVSITFWPSVRQVAVLGLYLSVLFTIYLLPTEMYSPCIQDTEKLKPAPKLIAHRGAPMVTALMTS